MKVLLLVHVEETFREWFRPDMLDRIVEAIDGEEYDRVFHFTSFVNDENPVDEIVNLMDRCIQWGWGYEPEVFSDEDKEREHVIASHGHDYTWVPPELREWASWLKEADVTLGGGCDGECLADMESVLHHLNIPYTRRYEFIY